MDEIALKLTIWQCSVIVQLKRLVCVYMCTPVVCVTNTYALKC